MGRPRIEHETSLRTRRVPASFGEREGPARLSQGGEDAQVLCRALRAAKACKDLNLQGNKIGDEGAAALAQALREGAMPRLKGLNLGKNGIGTKGVAALADSLREGGAPDLKVIWITVAPCTSKGAPNSVSKAGLNALESARSGLKVDRAS